MSLLDTLAGTFSGKQKFYTPLDEDSEAARRVHAVETQLQQLAEETGEPLEAVPAADTLYVFIGKPPEELRFAWFEADGQLKNFETLRKQEGVSPPRLERVADQLRDAYRQRKDAERYTTMVGDRGVTVTPDSELAAEVRDVMQRLGE